MPALGLSDDPQIMGIVNVTPDSFSDGGEFSSHAAAIEQGRTLSEDGAHVVDVGGESTRPGAGLVSADVEIARVLPVIEALVKDGIKVSVDTSKPEVMEAAVAAGARRPMLRRLSAGASRPLPAPKAAGTRVARRTRAAGRRSRARRARTR